MFIISIAIVNNTRSSTNTYSLYPISQQFEWHTCQTIKIHNYHFMLKIYIDKSLNIFHTYICSYILFINLVKVRHMGSGKVNCCK